MRPCAADGAWNPWNNRISNPQRGSDPMKQTWYAAPAVILSQAPAASRGLAMAACVSALWAAPAHADAVASLRSFVKDVQSGQSSFKQTVTSPDGKKVRTS